MDIFIKYCKSELQYLPHISMNLKRENQLMEVSQCTLARFLSSDTHIEKGYYDAITRALALG